MTKETAIKFKNDYIAKGARDFTKPSHFELPDLLEVHIEAVTVRPDDFHKLQGGVLYPRKETIDQFGNAAGVSFNNQAESTRLVGEAAIGRSQAYTMGPDGQPITGDMCEYEFNPEDRAEEDLIRAGGKPTDTEKRLKVLAYKKVRIARANTGARSRATVSVLGMQTGFKDLFHVKGEEVFLFSRVMINTKNRLLAEAMVSRLSGNTVALFGPQSGQKQVAGTATKVEDPQPSPGLSDDVDFDLPPDPVALKKATLTDLLDKYEDRLNPAAVEQARAAANSALTDKAILSVLDSMLARVKESLAKQEIFIGGEL